MRTHYDNLHISEKASPEVIRAAYKALAQKWHPDRNADQREKAEHYFKIISAAFEVLSDPERRARYDAYIAAQRHKESAHDQPQPQPESEPVTVYPWRRFLVRNIDNVLLGVICFLPTFIIWAIFTGSDEDEISDHWLSFSIVLLALISFTEAAMISLSGYTPAKWLFGLRVRDKQGERLKFVPSMKRAAGANFFGQGAYIPFIGIITNLLARSALIKTKTTTWDEHAKSLVEIQPFSRPRKFVAACLAIMTIGIPVWVAIDDYLTDGTPKAVNYEYLWQDAPTVGEAPSENKGAAASNRKPWEQYSTEKKPSAASNDKPWENDPVEISAPLNSSTETAEQARERLALDRYIADAIRMYPGLDSSSPDANNEAIEEALAVTKKYQANGYSTVEALQIAVNFVAIKRGWKYPQDSLKR